MTPDCHALYIIILYERQLHLSFFKTLTNILITN